MTTAGAATDVAVIGYGSLMSGLGLQPFGRLHVRAGARVALDNARRGFAKFSQHGDRFALALDPIDRDRPLTARRLSSGARATEAIEAMLLVVGPDDFDRICAREGYAAAAAGTLRRAARARGCGVAMLLWNLLEAAEFDAGRFRARLFELIGYTSPHYIPHPVRCDDGSLAIAFLAPGSEGSGSDTCIPVRVRTGMLDLLNTAEVWRRKPNATQLAYIAACVLGRAHGICVADLLTPMHDDTDLHRRLHAALDMERPRELQRFLQMTGLDSTAYAAAFGTPPAE